MKVTPGDQTTSVATIIIMGTAITVTSNLMNQLPTA